MKLTDRQNQLLKSLKTASDEWIAKDLDESPIVMASAKAKMHIKQAYGYIKLFQAHKLVKKSGHMLTKKGEEYLEKSL